jgi:glycosyltransferase involved in cell wall biosynthesis
VKGPVAFVVPRSGPGVVGGAEAVAAEAARGLAARGWDVEILTTCAVDHYTWANDLPPGTTTEGGVTVRRWALVHDGTRAGMRAQRRIQAGVVPGLDEQVSWLSLRFQVPGLFHHLLRHGARYQAVVFAPYMFWTTTVCLPVVAERAICMPCLHDETYARLDVIRPVLADPASVWFLSEPEHELAHRLGPVAGRHAVVGAGVDVPAGYQPAAFRRRHGLERPFLLFAGRREADKGWPWLLQTFDEAVTAAGVDFDLVTTGVGEVEVPDRLAGRVVDLGFLPEDELGDAFAAATAYAQPSRMESFSRTIMESWLAGTPVLAWDRSEVVAWHCRRSGGGRTFADSGALADCLRWLVAAPDQAAAMAERGRRYVLSEYTWPAVLGRMEESIGRLPPPAPAPEPPPSYRRVMVVGSYPPSPRPTASLTLDQVRQAYGKGDDVVVVAARHGAGHRTNRISGSQAAEHLNELRRQTGARRLVFCAEPGLPLPALDATRSPAPVADRWRRRIAAQVAARFPDFDHVTLVASAAPGSDPALDVMRAAADEVVTAAPPVPGPGAGAVTLFGPPEVLPRERPRQVISIAARAVLGRRAPAVRRQVATAVHRLRSVRRRE